MVVEVETPPLAHGGGSGGGGGQPNFLVVQQLNHLKTQV